MSDKNFKSIDEQLEILRSRGLSIKDDKEAKEFLLHNNYYRISGYSLTMRKNDVFSKNATFQNIIDIYDFDHELRHILLKYIEIIEVTFKSIYAYEFTKIHGPTGYLDSSFFSDVSRHKDILQKSESQKKKRLPHEAYLKHFVGDLNQDVPLWAYVDLLTIADISILYSITEKSIKKAVANQFSLSISKGDSILGQFMHSMTIIRNLCAHGSRLYNRLFEQKPSLNKKELSLLIKKTDNTVDNAHLYGFILIMKRLLNENDFISMKEEIFGITDKYTFVRMSYYGFRNDWKNIL